MSSLQRTISRALAVKGLNKRQAHRKRREIKEIKRRSKRKEMKTKDKPRRQQKKRFKKPRTKKYKPFNPWITKYFDLTGNGIESRDKNDP